MRAVRCIVPLFVLAASIGPAALAARQQPRTTDIFLAAIDDKGIGAAQNITANPGYDNQLAFAFNSRTLLFTSNRDGRQTDIYRYDLRAGRSTRVTKSDQSEYLPMQTPDDNGVSAIRLDVGSTQRLWRFRSDGTRPTIVLDNSKNIGSYLWLDKTRVAIVVTDARRRSMTLEFADTTGHGPADAAVIAMNVGRSLALRPKTDELSFVVKPPGTDRWLVKTVNLTTRRVADLVATVKDSEDQAWTPAGDLLMARGTTLYRWQPGQTSWTRFADLPASQCANLTRLAVSPDGHWLAFVAEPLTLR